MLIPVEMANKFSLAFDCATTINEWEKDTPLTFEALIDSLSLDYDSSDEVVLFLDSLGINESIINSFIGLSSDISATTGETLKNSIKDLSEENKVNMAYGYVSGYDFNSVQITQDELISDEDVDGIVARKAGYKRTLVIRGGKKVFINVRNPNKKVILSPKQKMALRKARRKANTGLAKRKRAKSAKKRKQFKL